MAVYLTNTFSPAMLCGLKTEAAVGEVSLELAQSMLTTEGVDNFISALSHENTAEVLASLLEMPVEFNRVNIQLVPGDIVVCIIPKFRPTETREFTRQEVMNAGFRCFWVLVSERSQENLLGDVDDYDM